MYKYVSPQSLSRINIRRLATLFVPLVLISKLVRHTIMYERLVALGIGWKYINSINTGGNHFGTTLFSFSSYGNHGSVARSNVLALCELFNTFINDYYSWEIAITVVFNVFLYITIKNFYLAHPYVSKTENCFIYLNIVVLNIFCFCLAKEFFQMIFWFITMYAIKDVTDNKKGIIRVGLALGLTVLFTRKYYGLVFVYFFIVNFFVNKIFMVNGNKKITKSRITFGVVMLLCIMAIMYYIMSYVMMLEAEDIYEELERVNTTYRGGGASSAIVPIFEGGGVSMLTLEYFVKILRLMFPLELLFRFKSTYVIFIIFQGMLFYVLFNNLKFRKYNTVEMALATDLYIAFWLTSAAFEPDFGSWIRHQSVVLPVMLYMLGGNWSARFQIIR